MPHHTADRFQPYGQELTAPAPVEPGDVVCTADDIYRVVSVLTTRSDLALRRRDAQE